MGKVHFIPKECVLQYSVKDDETEAERLYSGRQAPQQSHCLAKGGGIQGSGNKMQSVKDEMMHFIDKEKSNSMFIHIK